MKDDKVRIIFKIFGNDNANLGLIKFSTNGIGDLKSVIVLIY
jgi:hypothetical protein